MQDNSMREAAAELRAAYGGDPIAPLRRFLEPTDAAGAYSIQLLNTRFWEAQGRRIVGRKVGLTSKAVQAQLGVDQPDYGVLFADMLIDDGGALPAAKVLQPKAEAEIALVLGRDLDLPHATFEDVLAATSHVCAAIEIVDSRIADWKITFADTVADNGSSAFFVLGRERHAPDGQDPAACEMVMEVNGQVASTGVGAACLGHPFNAAAWLARTLSQGGEALRAGDVVMTGALGPMVAISPGDTVEATISGLGRVGFFYQGDAG